MLRLHGQVDTLAVAFLDRTDQDIPRLRSMVASESFGDRSALDAIERMSHAICGTGSLFGFPDISAIAGAMEQLVCKLQSNGQTASEKLLELIEQLTRAVADARLL